MSIDSNPTSEAQHKTSTSADSSAEVSSSASTGKRRRQRIARPASSEPLIRVKVSDKAGAAVTHHGIDASEMVKPRDINAEKVLERRFDFDEQHLGGRSLHKVTTFVSLVGDGNQDDPVIYPFAKQRGKGKRPTAHSGKAHTSSPRRKRETSANSTDRKSKRSSAPRRSAGQRTNKQRKDEPKPRTPKAPVEPVHHASPLVGAGKPIRLNKFLSNSGLCSCHTVDQYIAAGRVKVNGAVVFELGSQVLPTDQVMADDKLVTLEAKVYALLNKPKNCVTTLADPEGRHTVMDLVHNACTGCIYPIGRLNRSTTDILLLIDDSDLAIRLTYPAFRRKRIYEVALDKEVTVEYMQMVAHGFELEDGGIYADAVSYITGQTYDKVDIEIHSGHNCIVRRIFEYLGYRVVHLDRVYHTSFTKKDLSRGHWRYLTPEEVRYLHISIKEQGGNDVAPTTEVYHKHQETPDHPFSSEEIED